VPRERNDFGDIDFTSEEEMNYFQEAILGEQFKDFLTSNIGRLLHGRAKADYEDAKEQLLSCNPDSFFGRKKVKRLQAQAAQADNFMRWCADIIANGNDAEAMLETLRD